MQPIKKLRGSQKKPTISRPRQINFRRTIRILLRRRDIKCQDFFHTSRKSRWPFINNTKCVFKCYANLPKQAIVKQATENRNAMRHTSWWIESGKRIRRIRCPITSCFGAFNEPCTQRKCWMTGEITDGKLLVAERRHDHQINFTENPGHLHRHLSTQSISLNKVYG